LHYRSVILRNYVIDFRLYRLAFIPALLAVGVVMFSLEGAPDPLEPGTLRGEFDGARAAALAHQIVNAAPARTPGSEGDNHVADIVAEHMKEIPTGAVSEQRYAARYGGDDVTLRNVLLTLPGTTDDTVVVVAARDAARSPAAASSAAATGILIELANTFRISHRLTYVLASVSGSEIGAAGVRKLVESLPQPADVAAIVVISQPGAANPRRPFVVSSSTNTSSASAQLVETAALAVSQQVDRPAGGPGALTQLARLAIPSGLGDQAPLIGEGFDAVAISSAGERPLDSGDDQPDDVSPRSIDAFGRSVQSTIGAIDFATSSPVHGPNTYVRLGSNLIPGWALAALALALLLPAAVAAGDLCARVGRRDLGLLPGLIWSAACALPFIGALAVFYALALVGLVPQPDFPFDPGLYGLGARGAVTFALMLLVGVGSVLLLRERNITAAAAPEGAFAACAAIAVVALLVIWFVNPYLALLLTPTAHVWLLAAQPRRAAQARTAIAALVALVPFAAALLAVASALDLGPSAPWTFALMVADGQVGLLEMLAGSMLGGALAGAVIVAARRPLEIEGRNLPVG
jgi:hypothetical protein